MLPLAPEGCRGDRRPGCVPPENLLRPEFIHVTMIRSARRILLIFKVGRDFGEGQLQTSGSLKALMI